MVTHNGGFVYGNDFIFIKYANYTITVYPSMVIGESPLTIEIIIQ